PAPTPFPYTTLFRSLVARNGKPMGNAVIDRSGGEQHYPCLTIYTGRVHPVLGAAIRRALSETLRSHGWRSRAYRDVFTAWCRKRAPNGSMHPSKINKSTE